MATELLGRLFLHSQIQQLCYYETTAAAAASLIELLLTDANLFQPSQVNRAIMRVLLQTIYNSVTSCCVRGSGDDRINDARGESDSEDETDMVYYVDTLSTLDTDTMDTSSSPRSAAVDEETQILLQTSMQSRIRDYQTATAKTETVILGSAPTPFKREKSTSNVIEQFENMVQDDHSLSSSSSVSSSGHRRGRRRLRSPLLENSNHSNISASSFSSLAAIQTSIKNHVKSLPPCAACLETIYPTDTTVQSYGRTLHVACFVCRLCHVKLKHHPMEVQFELPTDDDDNNDEHHAELYCVCAPCQLNCMHRDMPKVVGTVAGGKIEVGQEELGDIQGVKDAIGDELEEIILEKMVPRCQVCAGDFLNYPGRVCVFGQMKYHNECWETGKPSANLVDRQLIPYQAAKYLPDRWIVRLLVDVDGDGTRCKHRPLATLFFVWSTRMLDFQRFLSTQQVQANSTVQIELELDDQAMGNPNYEDASKRKTQAILPGRASALHCELIGNPLSTALLTCSRADKRNRLQMQLQGTKYQVTHTMSLDIPKLNATTLDLAGVRLRFSLCQS